MPPAIEVSGLVKVYDGRRVVDGLSLSASPGTVLGLLGPNGAGKTTTVDCLAGFRAADGGAVRILGLDPRRERSTVAPLLGVMLQEGGCYQAATPREMLRLHARFYRRPEPPDRLLEDVGLTGPAADARFRTLSGGEKQRLNLALALVGRPRVALLDEPTAGMDPHGRRLVWDLVRRLRDDGVTVLLTTHAMDEAERLADVVAVIDRGRLVAFDSPEALTAAPASGPLIVTTPARFDAHELAVAIGAPVDAHGPGCWTVHVGTDRIPQVVAWFAERGHPLTGVTGAGSGLEEVFLRLTGGRESPPPRRRPDGAGERQDPAPGGRRGQEPGGPVAQARQARR